MTAPRRLLAALLAMLALVAFALLLWRWLPGPQAASSAAAPAPAAAPTAATIAHAQRTSLPPPRLQPAIGAEPVAPPAPMPEGLAQDLEMFDGVQLKAELESIALSHPEVRVLDAACTGLPCRAQVTSSNAGELTAFARAVHQRFQGHVSIRTERMPMAENGAGVPVDQSALRATFWVGTAPEPAP